MPWLFRQELTIGILLSHKLCRAFCVVGCPASAFPFPRLGSCYCSPAPSLTLANDIQLIQHDLVHYKPLGCQQCFSECGAALLDFLKGMGHGVWEETESRILRNLVIWVPRSCWVSQASTDFLAAPTALVKNMMEMGTWQNTLAGTSGHDWSPPIG